MSSKTLKRAGLKVTLPRKKVLEIFDNNAEMHISVLTIYTGIYLIWMKKLASLRFTVS